jgi:hypothetical protein
MDDRHALRRERWRLLAQVMKYAEVPLFVLSGIWPAAIAARLPSGSTASRRCYLITSSR